MTEELFREDAYLQGCEAEVVEVSPEGVVLDRTVFYPTAGGQPGDCGRLLLPSGMALGVRDTRNDDGRIVHRLEPEAPVPAPGTRLTAELDWARRYRLMRMHSCLHLLCRAVDGAVTGGQVGEDRSRLDFDLPEGAPDKEELTTRINGWVAEDRPIRSFWIDEPELAARPELVRTMSVQPPRGAGRVRLVEIDGVDLQACGGTHVRRTGEIGRVRVVKIENKGRHNRRVSVVLDEPGDG